MIVRTARSAAALAVATLLAAVIVLLVLPGIAHAKDLNCRDFTYQEQAQDVLDADRSDPNHLDDEGDGIACESLPRRSSGGPTTATTTTKTTPTATTTSATAAPVGYSTATTTTSSSTTTTEETTSSTKTSTTTGSDSDAGSNSDSDSESNSDADDDSSSSATSGDDRDCGDFASQADAQAALDADLSDPDHLDADVDGIACEDHFGNAGQQVQVHPSGGVDTGGGPADA
ncbi:hypothetical protein [Pseudonocardia charpentierae]|uniref:Excalibur calcium-binding domain-containing protein n=1 Tax=Pseudonocardia charpentierae TaxID=3075545 RepID=A0ABU2N8E1_9PSEU|nr:hypothetical protein [Pseudonocardia sp. DSM 45834]MDT0350208.1 hypothetical protein [Pseudonocardia sp. DSM 45834]